MHPEKDDQIILLGDLFNRGGESWEVFHTVKSLSRTFSDNFILLRGNHEDYLLRDKLTLTQHRTWDKVGKGTTVASFNAHGEKMEEAAPWIREHCRMYYKGDGFQCVHAGLLVDPIEANDTETIIHDHGIALRNCYKGPLTIVGHIALGDPIWFARDEETTEILPYGEWRELPEKGTISIDTGCGKGGKLTAMTKKQNKYNLICM